MPKRLNETSPPKRPEQTDIDHTPAMRAVRALMAKLDTADRGDHAAGCSGSNGFGLPQVQAVRATTALASPGHGGRVRRCWIQRDQAEAHDG